jgi:hypothetical protein
MNTPQPALDVPACGMDRRTAAWPLVIAIATAAVMIGSALLLKVVTPQWARVAVALSPVGPYALMFYSFARVARRLDEMWVRIQFEALALAFMTFAVLTIAWGQLQRVGVLPDLNLGFLWPVMGLMYALCLSVARRRYG